MHAGQALSGLRNQQCISKVCCCFLGKISSALSWGPGSFPPLRDQAGPYLRSALSKALLEAQGNPFPVTITQDFQPPLLSSFSLVSGSLPLRHPKLFLLSFVPSPNLSHGELSHSLEGVGGLRSSSSEEDLHCIRDLGRDTLVTSKEQTTNGGISASKMGQGKLFLD